MSFKEKRKLAAIMFTDIVGYSKLSQKDEALALELLDRHCRMMRPLFPKHGGKEIKTIGDAFLVEFESAVEAVKCAVEIQGSINRLNNSIPEREKIQIRIGIHVGDIIQREGDILGDGVNITSRIEPLAEPGGICLTDQVFAQIRNKIDVPVVSKGKHKLKNIESPIDVYRVVLPWEDLPSTKTKPSLTLPSFLCGNRKWLLSLLLSVFACGIIAVFLVSRKPSWPVLTRAGQIRAIAVLPLENFSADTEQEYLADGMTEALISELSRIRALHVISRTSVMRYKKTNRSLREIASELNVDAVIEGSVQLAGGRIRVTAQLIEAETDQHLWANNYDRDLSDILVLQSEVAQEIAQEIKVTITPEEHARMADLKPVKPEAYEAYLKGRFFINKVTEAAVRKGIEYFELAVEKDADYALAYAGLAESYDILTTAGWMLPEDGWPEVKQEAIRALSLDETLAMPHTLLGEVKFVVDWDWKGAEIEYKRAIELNPGHAIVHQYYAIFLSAMGRHDEAVSENRHALQLDPLSLSINQSLGALLRYARRYDESIQQLNNTLSLDPNFAFAHLSIGRTYLNKKMFKEAVEELEEAALLTDNSTTVIVDLIRAIALSGKPEKAEKLFNDLMLPSEEKYLSPYNKALIYCALGKTDRAFEHLEKAYEKHSNNLVLLKIDPRFENIRSRPRFKSLMRKLRLQ